MVGSLRASDVLALRGRKFQRQFFSLPNRSVLTVWVDKAGAVRLTVNENPSILERAVLEEGRMGDENGPDTL